MTQEIESLAEIADRFDAYVVDQYGVLHDGSHAFPEARGALDALRGRGCPIAALTNSGKRAASNSARLARMGFPPDLFQAVLSSGELARARLEALPSGTRVVLFSRDGETELLDGLDLARVGPDAPADLVVLAGVNPDTHDLDGYADQLAPHAARGTKMLLANPDHLMSHRGATFFGAGAVADRYRAAGGPVEDLGKPAPAMFEAALTALGAPDPGRVLMIGDSPAHDIAGAASVGMATLLIRGGVQSALDGAAATFAMSALRYT